MKERINSVIAHAIFDEKKAIDPADNLISDLGADSLDMIEIVMSLEERFSIEISEDDWAKVKSVGDVYALVEGLVNADQG